MTILTPGSPYNSTERINDITFKVLLNEIRRGNDLMMVEQYKRVFEKVDFINEYPLFIEIDICGENVEPTHEK